MHIVKFFTSPPEPYPYILINVIHPKFSFLEYAKEVIIDSGVEIFRDPNVKDYPINHAMRLLKVYSKVKRIVRDKPIYITVPDYPDDYNPKSLWINEQYTNIERTLDNILFYTEKYRQLNWLIPIQGWNKNPKSVLRTISLYKEHGIIEKFNYFAVANLCVESNVEIMYQTLKLVRNVLPDKRLHVFGLRLNALKKVYYLIDSFDSTAWTKPVDKTLNANYSCKNNEQRIKFFERWLEKYNMITNKTTLDNFLKN